MEVVVKGKLRRRTVSKRGDKAYYNYVLVIPTSIVEAYDLDKYVNKKIKAILVLD